MFPGDATDFVKPLWRDDFFVGGNLQNGIRRGVKDRIAGIRVFSAQLLEDRRAALWIIADEFNARFLFDRLYQLVRKSGKDCERHIEDSARNFPMSCGGIFS